MAPEASAATGRAVLAAALLALLPMQLAVVALDYRLRDADSLLYSDLADQLAAQPVSTWLSPQWTEGRPKTGLFVEHLACFLWPSAALGKLGVPKPSLAVNFALAALVLVGVYRLARALAGRTAGWAAVGLYSVSPWALQYLVRANHENAWMACGLFALEAAVSGRPRRLPGLMALAFLVKGVLAVLLLVPLAWVFWRRKEPRAGARWVGLSALACAAAALAYELAFRAANGASFFGLYLDAQLAYVQRWEGAGPLQKLLTPLYYLANAAWFALPATLVLLRRPKQALGLPAARAPLEWSALSLGLVSLMTRRAARYAVPTFGLLAVAAGAALVARSARVAEWLDARQRRLPWLLAALWLALFAARMVADRYAYAFVNPLGSTPAS